MDVLLIAITDLFEPLRLLMLLAGVALGLVIGVIPGIGGIFGLTILVPVTYTLDPISAFALLLGMASVTTTSDTIPAVMIGVPGTVGAAATVLDGHELAKQNQAARALGAAYSASLIGGVFGALVLALSLPIMRPLVLMLNFGDLLAITAFGLTLVALLSGGNQAKGLLAALLGTLVAYIGLDPHLGIERWTFDQVYLWDGVPTAIVFLGLFGLSELESLIRRGQIQSSAAPPEPGGMSRGIRDTLRNWPLVLRSSALGSLLGAVPGVGVTVIEWIAYGDAARRPGTGPAFGKGNIRGVIAPESANNAKEGGALLPTLAFGIPGSATMAILLGAFAIHGISPGPEMLESNAPLLVTMVLTIALANVIGAGICLAMTPTLARIALVPATTLVPIALAFVALGAFHAGKDVLDFVFLIIFGILGVAMKRLGWSRPAFALGFVLAPNLERFFFLSYQISGWAWTTQPLVLVILAVVAAMGLRQLNGWRRGRIAREPVPKQAFDLCFTLIVLAICTYCGVTAMMMPFGAAVFPAIVSVIGVTLGLVIVVQHLRPSTAPNGPKWDLPGDAQFLIGVLALCGLILTLGHLVGPAAFVLLCAARLHAPSAPRTVFTACAVAAASYLIFDTLVSQPWPRPWIVGLW